MGGVDALLGCRFLFIIIYHGLRVEGCNVVEWGRERERGHDAFWSV